VLVVEDTEARDLSAKPIGVGLGVGGGDAEQHAETAIDRADDVTVYGDTRLAHALDDRTHARLVAPGNTVSYTSRSALIPDDLHIPIPYSGFSIPIHVFGICLAVAFLAAGKIAAWEFERRGWNPDEASNALVAAAVGGIVGSRLWVVIESFSDFLAHPFEYLFTGKGFVFYGGLFGGAAAVTWVFRRARIPWLAGADAVAPAIAVGQAIGRIGCQLSGDGDWGVQTTLPWGMAYPHAVVGWPYPPGVYVHPTPVYETILYMLTFAVLWRLRREPYRDGTVFAVYLVLTGIFRFLVECLRVEPVIAFGLTSAQLVGLLIVPIGLALLWRGRRWQTAAA
jgi:phosphatidylglycerol:prolipoprotein diacylglycerol transferase